MTSRPMPPSPAETVTLAARDASVTVSLVGAELQTWRIGVRDLLWGGDPAHWRQRAPVLFPVVGASSGGIVRIGSRTYPMPRHGFAQGGRFAVTAMTEEAVRLRLTDSEATRVHFPFRFLFDVEMRLTPDRLALGFTVTNTGAEDLPYALGFHPGFSWPFAGGQRPDYAIEFEAEERPEIPTVTPEGLLRPGPRRLPLVGRRLALDPGLFTSALCLLNARSRCLRFVAPSGVAIRMEVENFSHLALWTKPDAPFLAVETWTGHGDPEGFAGDLFDRPSMRRLTPGETAEHTVALVWEEPFSLPSGSG